MHDTLQFLRRDPIHRKWHMTELTFRSLYQFHENFMLPLSHDEVVHGKSSLVGKLAGDNWQKLANLRLLYAYQWAMPGKKMSFMGAELAQWDEWNHDTSLAWHLAEDPRHQGIIQLITRLNELYRSEPALHELDCDSYGYEWVTSDTEQCVYVFARRDQSGRRVLVVMNCTPRPRHNWRLGVDVAGDWRELLNTDAKEYGGSGIGNFGRARAAAVACHGQPFSLELTLPPLAVLYLQSASATLSSANG
jgi:1,4-alpha-glucan branching enzyme